jgi:hypothetical protein
MTNVTTTTKDVILMATDREAIRREVVDWWLEEEAGDRGTKHCYRYNVEQLSDSTRVYLTRPARLNKGMDFVIKCEAFLRFKNGNDRPPRHLDIMAELLSIAPERGATRDELVRLMLLVWDCDPPDDVLSSSSQFAGHVQVERVLKLLKWFFIEQDLTYWTESGRWMLRIALESHLAKGP